MVRVDVIVMLHFSGPDCDQCGAEMLLENNKTAAITENNPAMGLQTGANGETVFKGIFYCPDCGNEIDAAALMSKAWLLG